MISPLSKHQHPIFLFGFGFLTLFVSRLLEKNYENRSFAAEVLEHPFFASIPENSHHVSKQM
jgi:hypothetical protein